VVACRELIQMRFHDEPDTGAAAALLGDGSILTGTSPNFPNPSTTVCHETEPYLAAFRLNQTILASLCLHHTDNDRFLVLSPCGICQERCSGTRRPHTGQLGPFRWDHAVLLAVSLWL